MRYSTRTRYGLRFLINLAGRPADLVLGSTNLEDLCEKLDLDFQSDDYDTIGGYLIGLLDHLPEKNEIIITDDDVLLRVEQMDKNRIEKIYIKKPAPKEED